MPLLSDQGALQREAIFWHFPHYQHAGPNSIVRSGPWKLIKWYETDTFELFNLPEDLSEEENLAVRMPEKVRQLDRKLTTWLAETGAKANALARTAEERRMSFATGALADVEHLFKLHLLNESGELMAGLLSPPLLHPYAAYVYLRGLLLERGLRRRAPGEALEGIEVDRAVVVHVHLLRRGRCRRQ